MKVFISTSSHLDQRTRQHSVLQSADPSQSAAPVFSPKCDGFWLPAPSWRVAVLEIITAGTAADCASTVGSLALSSYDVRGVQHIEQQRCETSDNNDVSLGGSDHA
ncbi:hypothetical protein [Microbacterium sp. PM5]|uniref:hypothetical protein n=1 Tax=Microbacterium sp. PM5 TaxID=2014534 RepID=UPI000DD11308|nr:hypothetical protein [Microbacterium sp. PM5]AXA95220.1 hypothetical protein CEP17_01615 [Microbacterium sp. PM5]